jgi:hypothetical protein
VGIEFKTLFWIEASSHTVKRLSIIPARVVFLQKLPIETTHYHTGCIVSQNVVSPCPLFRIPGPDPHYSKNVFPEKIVQVT